MSATVEINPPSPSGILGYRIPDEKLDVVGATEGIVLLRRGENPSEVLELLKEKIADLEARELPKGVHLRIYDAVLRPADHPAPVLPRQSQATTTNPAGFIGPPCTGSD
jgi:hypothetical protein